MLGHLDALKQYSARLHKAELGFVHSFAIHQNFTIRCVDLWAAWQIMKTLAANSLYRSEGLCLRLDVKPSKDAADLDIKSIRNSAIGNGKSGSSSSSNSSGSSNRNDDG